MSPRWKIALPLVALMLIPASAAVKAAANSDTYKELDALMDVFERVRSNYVDKVDDKKLIDGAINGMLASLDPHSNYMDATETKTFRDQMAGEYGGLGLSVSIEDGAVKVIAPIDDTPAARAGIKSGDYITHLDGELILGSSLQDAVDKMRGDAGTKIKLTVARDDQTKPLEFTLTREIVRIKSVKYETRGTVGVIRLSTFDNKAGDGVNDAIAAIQKKLGAGITGYILDLRSDPGGSLDQAINVSDTFLDGGEVVSQRGRTKADTQHYYAKAGDRIDGKPLIVLVDQGSASASEIVAGALQDHRRALILGERTFGKGSVQTWLPLADGNSMRLTTARYYTPSGRSVQENGIDPDIQVPQLSDASYKDKLRIREADLRRHFINQMKDGGSDKIVEDDAKPDPRFSATAEDLKKKGVIDFQLDYALKLIERTGAAPAVQTASAK